MTTEELAQMFHDTYERLAPNFGYKTREASAVAWEHVPENNKKLMIAVAHEIIQHLSVRNMVQWEPPKMDSGTLTPSREEIRVMVKEEIDAYFQHSMNVVRTQVGHKHSE